MKIIFLIVIGLSLLQADFIRDDIKEIVLDTKTNLIWQDNNTITSTYIWTDAITQCENLSLGGFNDWRLPNFNELYLLADRSTYNPAINSVFVNGLSSIYWSSTTYAQNTASAWVVYFNDGVGNTGDKTIYMLLARCVR